MFIFDRLQNYYSSSGGGGSNTNRNSSSSDDSSDSSSGYSLEELEAQREAVEEAMELEGQSEALLAEAARLDEAIAELREAKEREIEELERRIEEIKATDRKYAAKLEQRIEELRQYIRVLDDLSATIGTLHMINCDKDRAIALASVAGIANLAGQSAASVSPSLTHAANRLQEEAQVAVLASVYINEDVSNMSVLGVPIFCAVGIDPVNLATGNFLLHKRGYNSAWAVSDSFQTLLQCHGRFR